MNEIASLEDRLVDRALARVQRLPVPDLYAAEALVAAMADWDAADLAAYRSSVIAELAKLHGRSPRGFLAVEIAALTAVGAAPGA